MLSRPRIRIRAGLEQRLHRLKVGRVLLVVRSRLRITRPRRPLQVDDDEERRRATVAREVGIGAALEQAQRQVEVAVQRGDQQRAGVIAGCLVDRRSAIEKREHAVSMPLTGRVEQRRQATLRADAGRVARRPLRHPPLAARSSTAVSSVACGVSCTSRAALIAACTWLGVGRQCARSFSGASGSEFVQDLFRGAARPRDRPRPAREDPGPGSRGRGPRRARSGS